MKDSIQVNKVLTLINSPMNRRTFCTGCIRCTAGMLLLTSSGALSRALASAEINGEIELTLKKKDIRKLFMQKGSCSQLYFYIMNYEFGHNKIPEEMAIDPLAGGIAQRGYQCGMLWGTSMGASTEAYRLYKDKYLAMTSAVFTTRQVVDAFVEITDSPDCYDITNVDFSKRFSKLKMVFSAGDCIDLAKRWYPKAVKTAYMSLTEDSAVQNHVTTCASEVVRKMDGSDEEMVMVSGFAGGLGLSGNACGALAAAIWMKTLKWCRNNPEKSGYSYKGVEDIIALFEEATQGEMLCHKITKRRFNSVDEHTEFVQKGGCEKIISLLAETKSSVE